MSSQQFKQNSTMSNDMNTNMNTNMNNDMGSQMNNDMNKGKTALNQTSERAEDTVTPRSLSSNVSEYGSSNPSHNTSPHHSDLTADANAFFESHQDQEDTKLSPAERAKKLEKEMDQTDFDQRRSSQGNADKLLNIGKAKDFKIE